ncbi:MAG: hypothetical protein U1E30_05065 [Rhodoblastus sp.]
MADLVDLAVDGQQRADDVAAERLAHGLVAEANSNIGIVALAAWMKIEADARLARRAGAGRQGRWRRERPR